MAENDLRAVAFPKLSTAQLASLANCPLTICRRCRRGDKLFKTGERDSKFFIIKAGEVEIVDESAQRQEITLHGPGEFTGEVSQLTGNPSIVSLHRPR